MNRIKRLLDNYRRQLALPWSQRVSGPERVWCAVYPPEDERTLRAHLGEFKAATLAAGHAWAEHDVTHAFAEWLWALEYSETYVEDPEALASVVHQFTPTLGAQLQTFVAAQGPDCVVALHGVAGLFGAARVSALLDEISGQIRGRLLVFFPGTYENRVYRLLDARDGWNYLATAITTEPTDSPR